MTPTSALAFDGAAAPAPETKATPVLKKPAEVVQLYPEKTADEIAADRFGFTGKHREQYLEQMRQWREAVAQNDEPMPTTTRSQQQQSFVQASAGHMKQAAVQENGIDGIFCSNRNGFVFV